MTGAIYFAVRYAVDQVNRDRDLAGMILTGVDDVFIPGGTSARPQHGVDVHAPAPPARSARLVVQVPITA